MEKIFQETFLTKVKDNTIKSRMNHKIENYQINMEVRISSFIIQPIKEKKLRELLEACYCFKESSYLRLES